MKEHKMVQKRLWKEKEFKLEDGILRLKEVGMFSAYEAELRYEDIIGEKRITQRPNYILFGAAGVLMWLSFANLISMTGNVWIPLLGVGFASLLFYVVYKDGQEILYLDTVDKNTISFFRDSLDERTVDEFITELLEQRKIFLVEKYWDCVDCFDQKMHNLDWLKNRNVVNIDEFKYLKEEMFHGDETEILPIGFHKRKCS